MPVVTKIYFQRISALKFVSSKGAAGSPCRLFHCLQCSGKVLLGKGENASDLKTNSVQS